MDTALSGDVERSLQAGAYGCRRIARLEERELGLSAQIRATRTPRRIADRHVLGRAATFTIVEDSVLKASPHA